ncbi:uncharacterized protein V5649_014870 [Rhynchonycteris naso]
MTPYPLRHRLIRRHRSESSGSSRPICGETGALFRPSRASKGVSKGPSGQGIRASARGHSGRGPASRVPPAIEPRVRGSQAGEAAAPKRKLSLQLKGQRRRGRGCSARRAARGLPPRPRRPPWPARRIPHRSFSPGFHRSPRVRPRCPGHPSQPVNPSNPPQDCHTSWPRRPKPQAIAGHWGCVRWRLRGRDPPPPNPGSAARLHVRHLLPLLRRATSCVGRGPAGTAAAASGVAPGKGSLLKAEGRKEWCGVSARRDRDVSWL